MKPPGGGMREPFHASQSRGCRAHRGTDCQHFGPPNGGQRSAARNPRSPSAITRAWAQVNAGRRSERGRVHPRALGRHVPMDRDDGPVGVGGEIDASGAREVAGARDLDRRPGTRSVIVSRGWRRYASGLRTDSSSDSPTARRAGARATATLRHQVTGHRTSRRIESALCAGIEIIRSISAQHRSGGAGTCHRETNE